MVQLSKNKLMASGRARITSSASVLLIAWAKETGQNRHSITQVGIPEPLEQPVVIRSWFRQRRIVFCWHAPLATVEGTPIHRFRVQFEGEGSAFATRPDFEKFITWKEGRALAQHVEAALKDQIREDVNIWQRSGPATKGKTFEVPECALVKFNHETTAMANDESSCPRAAILDSPASIGVGAALSNVFLRMSRKDRDDLRFAKLNKGNFMAAAFDDSNRV